MAATTTFPHRANFDIFPAMRKLMTGEAKQRWSCFPTFENHLHDLTLYNAGAGK